MHATAGSCDEAHFEEDIQKIHKGYRMLDDIERRLKGYLDGAAGARPPSLLA
jgi:hypothetical protein